jgi:hypothetical protein
LSRARSPIKDSHSGSLGSKLATQSAANTAATTGYHNGLTVKSSHKKLPQFDSQI